MRILHSNYNFKLLNVRPETRHKPLRTKKQYCQEIQGTARSSPSSVMYKIYNTAEGQVYHFHFPLWLGLLKKLWFKSRRIRPAFITLQHPQQDPLSQAQHCASTAVQLLPGSWLQPCQFREKGIFHHADISYKYTDFPFPPFHSE